MSNRSKQSSSSAPRHGLQKEDYYLDENGLLVFTPCYHLKRGYCCKNACRHCPYGFQRPGESEKTK
ncbi:DUF5522 domain-containing protein [Rhabdobacter roseus]|uniref:DUF5522 domain-containing protein n=1 Tax=Rhabdobacter roseus TaxID=1655419 RepID=UPI00160BAC93